MFSFHLSPSSPYVLFIHAVVTGLFPKSLLLFFWLSFFSQNCQGRWFNVSNEIYYVCDFLKVFLSFILRGLVGLSCIRLSNDLIRFEVRICAQNGVR